MNPVLVNRWRGSTIESRHRGAVSVVNASGHAVLTLGDVQQTVFPRSCIKFLQALTFVKSGAVEHYGLDNRHIALGCASHNGEPQHVNLVNEWLATLGLDMGALECGAELPIHQASAYNLMGEGYAPTRAHHNCSGKHLGMLSVCCHEDLGTENYRLYQHDVQRRWFSDLERFCSVQSVQLPWAYDGCGIPTLAMPLQRLALGMARFADPSKLPTEDQDAVKTVIDAITEHPYLVAGKDRLCTALMKRLAPRVVAKIGAEGCYAASIPERGLGIVMKLDDGNMQAVNVALGAVLSVLGELDSTQFEALEEYIAPQLTNSRGEPIGRMDASSEWQSAIVREQGLL